MKITVNMFLNPCDREIHEEIDVELNLKMTLEEWNLLDQEEKTEKIRDYNDTLPMRTTTCYWMLDDWEEWKS